MADTKAARNGHAAAGDRSAEVGSRRQQTGCGPPALEALATRLKLPAQWLHEQGVSVNEKGAIEIEYKGSDGEWLYARTASDKSKNLPPYGLWRLEEGRKKDYLILLGTEEDAWVCWYAGIPALALPVTAEKQLTAEHLEGIGAVYIIAPNTAPGRAFVTRVLDRLSWLPAWKGIPNRSWLSSGIGSVAELWTKAPDDFKQSWVNLKKTTSQLERGRATDPDVKATELPDPVPLNTVPEVPLFPVHLLPAVLAEWTQAEAKATQTPLDLAGMLALGVCGAALARRCRVQIREDWREPINLFMLVAMLIGERKSKVFADATAPVLDHERTEIERLAPIIAEAQTRRRQCQARLEALENKIGKEESEEARTKLNDLAVQVARELATLRVPATPRFLCDDATPEVLARLLAEQDGRMLLASPEGAAIEILKGRYSKDGKFNFEVYLKGHAGDALRVDRMGREAIIVDDPALSLVLAVQHDVLAGLASQPTICRRGILARFWFSLPRSVIGTRTIGSSPMSAAVRAGYRALILRLWQLGAETKEPCIIEFSPQAERQMRDFEEWLEPQLADGEELSFLAGWANKLAGAGARLAGIFHLVDGRGLNVTINAQTAKNAIAFVRYYLLPHALAAFGLLGADEREEKARRVWRAAVSLAMESRGCDIVKVSRRDLHQRVKRRTRFVTAKEIDPAIELLTDRFYLMPCDEPGKPGKGHRSPSFTVNPKALALEQKLSG